MDSVTERAPSIENIDDIQNLHNPHKTFNRLGFRLGQIGE